MCHVPNTNRQLNGDHLSETSKHILGPAVPSHLNYLSCSSICFVLEFYFWSQSYLMIHMWGGTLFTDYYSELVILIWWYNKIKLWLKRSANYQPAAVNSESLVIKHTKIIIYDKWTEMTSVVEINRLWYSMHLISVGVVEQHHSTITMI